MYPTLDFISGIMTLALLSVSILLLAFWVLFGAHHPLRAWLRAHTTLLILFILFGGVGGSLVYSDIVGFVPCRLCWMQRMFLFPLLPLFAFAFARIKLIKQAREMKEDRMLYPYGILLSSIGLFLATYHIILEKGVLDASVSVCFGDAVSCTTQYVHVFGFITIPVMSASIFTLVIILLAHGMSAPKESDAHSRS